ncbi:MAG: alpha/beta fold hydrolase [Gammaproteobacteria bacterium]
MPIKRHFLDGPYGQIHVRTAGQASSAAALVCLHMSPKSSWQFADLMDAMSPHRFVIAPDNPGHGESARPPATPHVTIEDYARCVWTAVDTYTDGPVFLLGSHTGAMVAVEAAHQRPERVHGIVSQSAPVMTPDEVAQFANAYEPIPLDEAGTRIRVLWERVLAHRGPDMPLQLCVESFAENFRGGDAYEWGHRAAFNYAASYAQKLAQLEQRILVINVNDDLTEHSRRADALMRNGERLEKPAWGHGFLSVHAQETAHIVERFCQDVEAAL